MKQKHIGLRMVRVRGKKLPNHILDDISNAIKSILERRQEQTDYPQKKEVVVIDAQYAHGRQTVIVGTRFSYSHKEHGFLFHAFLYLRNIVRRVAGYCARINFDTVKVTFAVEPTIGELAHN